EIIKGGLEILTALLRGIADNFGMILQTAFDILDELVKDLTEDDTLEKLIDAAIDIMNALLKFMFDNLPTILEEWVPKIMDEIAKHLMAQEDELDKAGNYLGGILGEAIWSGLKAIFATGKRIGMRAILNMMGIEGDYADIVMDLTEKAVPGIMTSQYWNQEDQPAPGTRPTASRREKNVETTPSINYSDDFIGPKMPNINLYSPVFNNTGDINRIAEQTRQLQSVAAASGGRY
ncbi:MAG: hypothetical protein J6Q22_04425, partial [Prevotella sp.]|nr:hypothetical protein [Prevotella sp.]